MPTNYKRAVTFLNDAGFGDSFLYERSHTGHLGSTYHYLREWGCSDQTCIAGLLHSAVDPKSGYDNEPVKLSDIPDDLADERVKKLIVGYYLLERQAGAENLRAQELQFDHQTFKVNGDDLRDIADIAIADRVDQVDWCWRKHDIAPTEDVLGFLVSSKGWTRFASPKARQAYDALLSEVRQAT